MTSEEKNSLVAEYAEKIKPILSLAKKAYGSRAQTSPAHIASAEYTQLLVDFVDKQGSLLSLANELGVAYSGLRRRVMTASLTPKSAGRKSASKTTPATDELLAKIKSARAEGTQEYYEQLAAAYSNGVSLSAIARGLGLSHTYPLYYGIQRHQLRNQQSRYTTN